MPKQKVPKTAEKPSLWRWFRENWMPDNGQLLHCCLEV